MKTNYFIAVLVLMMTVSCSKLNQEFVEKDDFVINIEASVPANSIGTRSSYPSGLANKVTDACIFVFRNGQRVSSVYSSTGKNISGRSLFINSDLNTSYSDKFNVYVLSNVGNLSADSQYMTESSMNDAIYSYDEDYVEFSSKGFPMASVYTDYCPLTDERVLLADKLVTQYNIRIVQAQDNDNQYTIKSAVVCDESNRIMPFAESFKVSALSEKYNTAERFTASDIAVLNNRTKQGNSWGASQRIPIYVLENHQGNVFGNTVVCDSMKCLQNLPKDYWYKCTYLELKVDVKTPTASYADVIYRYYFGDGVRDCSVKRNYVYDLDLDFDNKLVIDEGWRIVPGKPNVNNDALTLSKSGMGIIKGLPGSISITHKDNVTYSIECTTEGVPDAIMNAVSVTRTSSNGNVDNYTVSSNYIKSYNNGGMVKLVDYVDLDYAVVSSDGLVKKSFVVRVNVSPFVMKLDFDKGIYNVTTYTKPVDGKYNLALRFGGCLTASNNDLNYGTTYSDFYSGIFSESFKFNENVTTGYNKYETSPSKPNKISETWTNTELLALATKILNDQFDYANGHPYGVIHSYQRFEDLWIKIGYGFVNYNDNTDIRHDIPIVLTTGEMNSSGEVPYQSMEGYTPRVTLKDYTGNYVAVNMTPNYVFADGFQGSHKFGQYHKYASNAKPHGYSVNWYSNYISEDRSDGSHYTACGMMFSPTYPEIDW